MDIYPRELASKNGFIELLNLFSRKWRLLVCAFSPLLLNYTSPLGLAVFIISMSITHTFLDSIPSIFLGAPDADMAMAILPGHQLLLEGRGFEAVKLTVIGSLLCLLLGILIVPVLVFVRRTRVSSLRDWARP